MGTLQNITAEGLLSILGISGYNGIAVAKSQATATTLVITVTQPAYAMLGDGIILTSELVSTTVEDLSTDGDYRLYLDYEDVYEGRDVVWTVATSAPSPAALLIAAVTVAGNTISDVTSRRQTPLPSALTQPVAFTPPPPLSEWTWVSVGRPDPENYVPEALAQAFDIPGGVRITSGGDTSRHAILIQADGVLPEPPYTITTVLSTNLMPDFSEFGIVLYDSEDDSFIETALTTAFASFYPQAVIYSDLSNFYGSFTNLPDNGIPGQDHFWLRLQNDGTVTNFLVSYNGINWVSMAATATSDYTPKNRYGIIVYNNSGTSAESTPITELYSAGYSTGRITVDIVAYEAVPFIVDTTPFSV